MNLSITTEDLSWELCANSKGLIWSCDSDDGGKSSDVLASTGSHVNARLNRGVFGLVFRPTDSPRSISISISNPPNAIIPAPSIPHYHNHNTHPPKISPLRASPRLDYTETIISQRPTINLFPYFTPKDNPPQRVTEARIRHNVWY